MAETLQAPAVTRIPHWIGGRRVDGASGRSGPVYNPATGTQTGAVDFASVEEVDAAVAAAKEAFPAWRATSLARKAELFFRIRELLDERREALAEILVREHGKVFSDALGEVTRGARGRRVLLRPAELLKSEYSRAGVDRDRRLLDPPAARRRRGDHAVQLPGDGAHVDVGAGARVRQHVRAQAVGEGSVGVALDGRAAPGGRRARRRLQRRAWATRSRSTRCSSIPTSRRVSLRRLDADRALRLRDRDRARQARARRSAARRTT